MQISMKCSVAVHCLIFIHEANGIAKVTSNLLAQSTGCNPVVIRNVISGLKKAGLITVPRGTGGAQLSAEPSEITLYQIYSALEPDGLSELIGFTTVRDENVRLPRISGRCCKSPISRSRMPSGRL